MRVCIILIFFFSTFIFSSQLVFARDISITANKASLFGDEELVITASSSGFASDEQLYIKGAFFQDGTSNYFGFTKNNNEWIKNSASSQSQRYIKMNEWDGLIYVRNDTTDTGYKGDGSYKFKLGFYYTTPGGSISSVNWSTNTIDVALSYPSPTPTPLPTSTPTVFPTPTLVPTSTIAPTPLPTTRTVTKVQTLQPTATSLSNVLGAVVDNEDIKTPTPTQGAKKGKKIVMPPALLLLGVSVIITGCGILLFREWKKQKELDI